MLHQPLKNSIQSAFDRIFSASDFILGEELEAFEEAFAQYCGTKHCVTVHNGTVALQLVLLAYGIGPGDEVITAPNSFVATAEAIAFAGATPVFVDAQLETGLLDVSLLEAAITPRTKAIMPVHLYGQTADMQPIIQIAKKRGIKVIEDACQAHGAKYGGKFAGALADVGCFSFYPGKNLGAAGDGGCITTDDAELADKVKLLRSHGSKRKYHHEVLGHNFRLDTLQGAVLRIKLPLLDEWNAQRKAAAAFYNEALRGLKGITPLEAIDGAEPVFHLYVVRVNDREAVQQALEASGIACGIHYPVPIHLMPAFAYLGHERGEFPRAEALADTVLSVPIFPGITREQQELVVQALKDAVSIAAKRT